eukprot:GHVS01099125.1.p1 GENE.GHVS01099125.1~~GHVS01099125.1.p1  ORF type:complete len:282 (+),score=48.32 GHVS01099125.1:98-943(+)
MAALSGFRAFYRGGYCASFSSFGKVVGFTVNNNKQNNGGLTCVAAAAAEVVPPLLSVVARSGGRARGPPFSSDSLLFLHGRGGGGVGGRHAFSSLQSVVGESQLATSRGSSTTPSRLVALNLPPETFGEKVYRWADVTGFFTRWNSRKAWIMYLDPYTRIGAVMMTEYERKLRMFLNINEVMMFSLSVWIWWYFMNHFNSHPPPPKLTQDGIYAEHLGAHTNPFARLPLLQPRNRCYECRWLDLECKRRCFDKLRAEGHKFIIRQYPLTVPRFELEPPHHH